MWIVSNQLTTSSHPGTHDAAFRLLRVSLRCHNDESPPSHLIFVSLIDENSRDGKSKPRVGTSSAFSAYCAEVLLRDEYGVTRRHDDCKYVVSAELHNICIYLTVLTRAQIGRLSMVARQHAPQLLVIPRRLFMFTPKCRALWILSVSFMWHNTCTNR